MEKHAGDIPVNANITIDYTKEKPEVKFEYPNKNVMKQNRNGFLILIAFPLTILLFVGAFFLFFERGTSPTDCSLNSSAFYNNNNTAEHPADYYVYLDCNNGKNYTLGFEGGFQSKMHNPSLDFIAAAGREPSSSLDVPYKNQIWAVFVFLFLFLLFYVLVKVIDWLLVFFVSKTKWFKDHIPFINDKLHAKKKFYKKFESVPESKVIEIPMFQNFRLDYKATEEFSDYLTKFEIKNHDFQYVVLGRKGRIVKSQENYNLFKAVFTFSEIPKTGCLEVLWR